MPISLFYSYAHEDRSLCVRLMQHLSLLRRQEVIQEWHDGLIQPGTSWPAAVRDALKRADITLLLVSAYFLDSDFCYDVEMTDAMARHRERLTSVIPVILKPCDWKTAPFGLL